MSKELRKAKCIKNLYDSYHNSHILVKKDCEVEIVNVNDDMVAIHVTNGVLKDMVYRIEIDRELFNEYFEIIENKIIEECTVAKETVLYKGWDLIRMLHEGKLKEDTVIGDKYVVNNNTIRNEYGEDVLITDFLGKEFYIEEPKEYYTFLESMDKGKLVRNVGWAGGFTTHQNIMSHFVSSKYTKEEIKESMESKVWEVQK